MLATWSADWTLFGWKAAAVLTICLFMATTTASHYLLPEPLRRTLICIFPAATLAGFWLIDLWRMPKQFHAELDAARVICLAFAFGFSIDSIRYPNWVVRILGVSSLMLVGFATYNHVLGRWTVWNYYAD